MTIVFSVILFKDVINKKIQGKMPEIELSYLSPRKSGIVSSKFVLTERVPSMESEEDISDETENSEMNSISEQEIDTIHRVCILTKTKKKKQTKFN